MEKWFKPSIEIHILKFENGYTSRKCSWIPHIQELTKQMVNRPLIPSMDVIEPELKILLIQTRVRKNKRINFKRSKRDFYERGTKIINTKNDRYSIW